MDDASVQRGLQKALNESSSKTSRPKNDAELAPTDSDASSRSGSPDQCCSICLGKFRDKSFSDGCFHRFCFQCIREWAKVKSTCPLCKTPFKSIIHNVVSSDVYDQYVLQPSENGSFELDHSGARFRYHTTLTNNRRSAWETRMDQLFNRQARLAARIHRENEARQRRQLIYAAGLRVHHIAANRFTRFRDTSPHFFRENPAMAHRLIPWLRRDLGVLFNGNSDHVTFMTQYIISLLPNVDIQSEEFHNHLRPFLYGRTEHFIHEFTSFARSPHEMETYDQMAQYDFRPENPQFTATLRPQLPLLPQENSSSNESDNQHSNNNNNEVIVISDDDDDEDGSDSNPIVVSLESSSQSRDNPGPSAADAAGPSMIFDFSSTHNPEPPAQVDFNQPGPSGVHIKKEEDSAHGKNAEGQSEDSSGSVEIVGYEKPYHLRTPIAFITISDDTSDAAKEEQAPESRGKLSRNKTGKSHRGGAPEEKAGGKRKQKTKHTRSSYSASRTGSWSTDSDDSYHNSRHDRHYRRSQDTVDRRNGVYSSSSRGQNGSSHHQDSSRDSHELYRKIREEKYRWSVYYETRHDYHSSSSRSSRSRHRRSRSRSRSRSKSKSSYSRRHHDDYHYGDYGRSHELSRYSREDHYRRRGSRSRSRSRERSRPWRDGHRHRSRSRSKSRSKNTVSSVDLLSDESRNSLSLLYNSRHGSTSSTFSRFSQQELNKPLGKDNLSPNYEESVPKAIEPAKDKRKRDSESGQEKEDETTQSRKKHKHKHKHHKKKSSRHRHKSKSKDKHSKQKKKDGTEDAPNQKNSASDSTLNDVEFVSRKTREKLKDVKKLQTFINPNEPHLTLQDLLNMGENDGTGHTAAKPGNDSHESDVAEVMAETLFQTQEKAMTKSGGED